MRRGLGVRSFIILAVACGLQVASLALTCAEHWVLPTAQHHHRYHNVSLGASGPTSGPHSHEECSLEGTPAVMLLVVPGFDCFCDGPSSITLPGVLSGEGLTAADDSYYERILLEIFPRPPIF